MNIIKQFAKEIFNNHSRKEETIMGNPDITPMDIECYGCIGCAACVLCTATAALISLASSLSVASGGNI